MSMPNQERRIILLAEAAGGVMRHVIDLYKGLKAKAYPVKMVLSPLRIESRYLDELGDLAKGDILYVPMRRAPHTSDVDALLAIRTILKALPPKVILHTHSTKAGSSAPWCDPRYTARSTLPMLIGALIQLFGAPYARL
jgi:hypothetical protein